MEVETDDGDKVLGALSNHVILGPILNNLDLKDLKSARLVCQSWSDLASPILLRNSCLHLRLFQNQIYHAESFYGSVSKDGEYFISNVKLVNLDIITEETVKLFSSISPWTDDIDITFIPFMDESDLRAFVGILYRNLHNARRITLRSRGIYEGEERRIPTVPETLQSMNLQYFLMDSFDEFPINWVDFFVKCPNIKEFHMRNGTAAIGQAVLESISSARKINPGRLILQKLSLTFTDIQQNEFKILWDLIKTLDFSLDGIALTVPDVGSIKSVLSEYANTLREAKLDTKNLESVVTRRLTPIIFTPMKCLKSLELDQLSGNFDFLVLTKTLKSLTIRDTENGALLIEILADWALTISGTPLNLNLSSLHIKTDHVVNAAICEAIGKSFPNLKILSLRSNDDGIRMIFKHLVDLEVLSISGGLVTDSGITGLGAADIEDVENLDVAQVNRFLPYIGNLTKLKRFQLSDEFFEHITDVSVRYGLKDLVNLIYIDLPRTSISPIGIQSLGRISKENLKIPERLQPLSLPIAVNRFSSQLPAEVSTGTRITFFGTVRPNAQRIAINLHMESESDVAFHFNPRWDEGVTVLNTCIGGNWGMEEKFFYHRLYSGIEMSVRITCQTESFLIEVNDYTPITYKYRVPPEKITGVKVSGDFDVHQVYVCY